jgi:hypothetical protein
MHSQHPAREISLNIIALSVFALMLSSLVGPLVQFSTIVPTTLIVGLLVGASLDSFFLQSRCANLLLDAIARRDPAYAQRIVHHEAGHLLVALLLEIPVTGYSLSAWEAWQQGQVGQGGVSFAPPPSQISGKMLQNYCTVWMAGIAAEQLIYGSSLGGSDDRQQVQGMLQVTGTATNGLARAESTALQAAQQHIINHRAAFDALVQALQERQPVAACQKLVTAP